MVKRNPGSLTESYENLAATKEKKRKVTEKTQAVDSDQTLSLSFLL